MDHNLKDKKAAFKNHIVPCQSTLVSKADRELLNGHRGAVL